MKEVSLSFYERLARWGRPRSYHGKFLLVAFIGTHVPMLTAATYVLLAAHSLGQAWPLLLTLLGATLAGTATTLFGLYRLLAPIPRSGRALRGYAEDGTLPDLPVRYGDQAGRLMHDTQTTLERLDRLVRFRDRLFSVVLHDLRSPATSVLLAVDALDDELKTGERGTTPSSSETTDDLLDMIRQSTQQQLAFTETLMEHLRRDTVRFDVRPETVRPLAMLEALAADHRLTAQRRGVDLRVEDGGAPEAIHTDTRLLRQVLQNLTANAVAYSPATSVVRLRAAREGDRVVFAVQDEGEGLTDEALEHLFNPFQTDAEIDTQVGAQPVADPASADQSQPASSGDGAAPSSGDAETQGGYGLGLWIAQTFAQLLGGKLEAHTAPGEGTTFRLSLPLEAPPVAPERDTLAE